MKPNNRIKKVSNSVLNTWHDKVMLYSVPNQVIPQKQNSSATFLWKYLKQIRPHFRMDRMSIVWI